MKDILEEIVAHKRREIEQLKASQSERELQAKVERECRDAPPQWRRHWPARPRE